MHAPEAGHSSESRHRMIQAAAYLRAERRGFNGGDPGQDWLEAEQEVDRILQRAAGMEAYLVRLDELLAQWDGQFRELQNKTGKTKTELRVEYDKQLTALARKRAAISKSLQKLRSRSVDAWDDLREGIDKAWSEMYQATEKAASHFKESRKKTR